MIYAYGIGEREPRRTLPSRGLGGAALRAVDAAGLRAFYTGHRTLRPRPSPHHVVVHERVVEALMAQGPILPMRFGTMLEDAGTLADAVAARHDALTQALARVRGRVELGLRVLDTREPAVRSAARTGRDYLLERAAEQRRADEATNAIHAPLRSLAASSVVRHRPAPGAVMAAAYLLDVDRVPEFRARANRLAGRHGELHVVVTGPWPAYSFVSEGVA